MESLSDLLSRQAHRIWRGQDPRPVGPLIASGFPDLDSAIGGGWPTGTLVEVLTRTGGLGQSNLLLPALATLTQAGKAIAWLPAGDPPYPPTLRQAGVELNRVLITASEDHHQRLWAAEQCLRSGACGAVVMTETRTITDPMLRRLKLAAAAGGAILFLLRSESVAEQASPATIRVRVRSAAFALQQREITILKGAHPPRSLILNLDARG